MEDHSFICIVEKVVTEGKHGPYAAVSSNDLGPITFALTLQVWKEEIWPEPGTYVVLSQVIKKRAGWRAKLGRFLQPSDEKKGETNES